MKIGGVEQAGGHDLHWRVKGSENTCGANEVVDERFAGSQIETRENPHSEFIAIKETCSLFFRIAIGPKLIEELNIRLRVSMHMPVVAVAVLAGEHTVNVRQRPGCVVCIVRVKPADADALPAALICRISLDFFLRYSYVTNPYFRIRIIGDIECEPPYVVQVRGEIPKMPIFDPSDIYHRIAVKIGHFKSRMIEREIVP